MIQSLHFLVDLLVDLVKSERSEVAQRPSERRSLEVDLFRLNGFESYSVTRNTRIAGPRIAFRGNGKK